MRKHVQIKNIALLLLCMVTILMIPMWAYAKKLSAEYENPDTGNEVYISDEADLLSKREEKKLVEDMKGLTDFYTVGFFTVEDNPYNRVFSLAEDLSDSMGGKDRVIVLIDMDTREICVDSYGKARDIITTSMADVIADNIYSYASDGDYYECASAAFEQIEDLVEGERIAMPMKYINNFLIAFFIALFVNFLLLRTSTKIRKASMNEMLSGSVYQCNINNPVAVFSTQTKVYSPPSSSSSGGGHSGGGHSGGGGHSSGSHRF